MCRLYAVIANEPTRVECSLVKTQNALMQQSQGDRDGLMQGHGWGFYDSPDAPPKVEKQIWPAYDGASFSHKAARLYARTVIAHVRRASIGAPRIENTQPFAHGHWMFAHTGTVADFDRLRGLLLENTDPDHRKAIIGATDSEHIFHFLLSGWTQAAPAAPAALIRSGIPWLLHQAQQINQRATPELGLVMTDGRQLAGASVNSRLWYLERERPYICALCKTSHVRHTPQTDYRAVVIASEPVTGEAGWKMLPDNSIFSVNTGYRLNVKALDG